MSETRIAKSSGLTPGWLRHASWSLDGAVVRALTADDIGVLRRWRNEQQDVLRQQRPLTVSQQQRWYVEEVVPTFEQQYPRQLLVAVEDAGRLMAYGGLTNLDWMSSRGELSFLAATSIAQREESYIRHLDRFLRWITPWTFDELGLNRFFSETWEFRTAHIRALERAGMVCEGRFRQHVVKNGVAHDALLHGMTRDDWMSE